MVAHVCNPSTQEARLRGYQFKVSLHYIEFEARLQTYVRTFLKKQMREGRREDREEEREKESCKIK